MTQGRPGLESIDFLKQEELITLRLRALYEKFGYKKYRMSKFEEYDLYLDNKNFLNNKQIITFNDLDGRVLALKPDVTLSIVKNTKASIKSTEKLYYLENVYRLDKQSHAYREINQLGMELIGRLDMYAKGEVMRLAAETLSEISGSWMMTLTNTAFVLKLFEGLNIDQATQNELIECIRLKNAHGIQKIASVRGITPAASHMLETIAALPVGGRDTVKLARAIAITQSMTDALDQLEMILDILEYAGYGDRVKVDFSLINDTDYYSGIVMNGYVEGVPRPVLLGGDYGNLMLKFGKELDAIGFAVMLNELDHLYRAPRESDVDALVLYPENADYRLLMEKTNELIASGLRVRVERRAPLELRCEKVYEFDGENLREVAQNA